MKAKLLKGALVVVGAVTFSTVGIFASDRLQGLDRNLVGLTGLSSSGMCMSGMAPIKSAGGTICVDIYEASPSEGCPHLDPKNMLESEANSKDTDCYAASTEGVTPWRFISLPQAQRMCAGAKKRLPTSEEWYTFSLGTDPDVCVTDASDPGTTGDTDCVSTAGMFDTIGNLWEWVDETVVNGMFQNRDLPEEGYVTSVDSDGMAITTHPDEFDDFYGSDYFWSKKEGVFGMIRGGFYGSDSDAGLYTVNASVPTTFASQGVGFRCVEDVL